MSSLVRTNQPEVVESSDDSPFAEYITTPENVRDAAAQDQNYKKDLVDSYIIRLKDTVNEINIEGKRGNPEKFYKTILELKNNHPELLEELKSEYQLSKDVMDNSTQSEGGGVHESAFSKLDYLKIGALIATTPKEKAKVVTTILLNDFDKTPDLKKEDAAKILLDVLSPKDYQSIKDAYSTQNPGRDMDRDMQTEFPDTFEKVKSSRAETSAPSAESRVDNKELMETLRRMEQRTIELQEELAELKEEKSDSGRVRGSDSGGYYLDPLPSRTRGRVSYNARPRFKEPSVKEVSFRESPDSSPSYSYGDLSWVKSKELLEFLEIPENQEKYLKYFETGLMHKNGMPKYVGEMSRFFTNGRDAQDLRFRQLLDKGFIKLSEDPENNVELRAKKVPLYLPEEQRMKSPYVSQAEYDDWRSDRVAHLRAEAALMEARQAVAERKREEERIRKINEFADRSVELDIKYKRAVNPSQYQAYRERHPVTEGLGSEPATYTYIESPEMVKRYTEKQLEMIGKYGSPEQKRAVLGAGSTYLNDEEYGEFLNRVDPERSAEIERQVEEEVSGFVESLESRSQTEVEIERDNNLIKQAEGFIEAGELQHFNSFLDSVKQDESVSSETIQKLEEMGAQLKSPVASSIIPDPQKLASAYFTTYHGLIQGGERSKAQLDALSQRIAGLPPLEKQQLNREFAEARSRMQRGLTYSDASMAAFNKFYEDLKSDFTMAA